VFGVGRRVRRGMHTWRSLGDNSIVRVLYVEGYGTWWVNTHRMAGPLYALTAELLGQLEDWAFSCSLSKPTALQREPEQHCLRVLSPIT
jgi:hypothetical protein